ncbi:hypothetical protein ACFZCU_21065 [Streptomyces canus]|uniref:hypothetical protein n=1 Tax=Streptomyces canus TaxID=58343 RepID=UPI0036E67387
MRGLPAASGLVLLTPAVVAAAIATVPTERSGLASPVNNTARRTGGAIGIAVAGAVAEQPSDETRFGASMPSRSARPASTRPPRRWR